MLVLWNKDRPKWRALPAAVSNQVPLTTCSGGQLEYWAGLDDDEDDVEEEDDNEDDLTHTCWKLINNMEKILLKTISSASCELFIFITCN